MRTFSFAVNQVPIYDVLLTILKKHGYRFGENGFDEGLEDLSNQMIERGITVTGDPHGNLGFRWYTDKNAEFNRLDELIIALESDDPRSFTLAQETVIEMEYAIAPDALESLLSAVPALRTFLEETKSQQKS